MTEPAEDGCPTCSTWGRTLSLLEDVVAIPCPDCRRPTWPNLGVNCPAGAAAALSTARVYELTRRWKSQYPPTLPPNLYARSQLKKAGGSAGRITTVMTEDGWWGRQIGAPDQPHGKRTVTASDIRAAEKRVEKRRKKKRK